MDAWRKMEDVRWKMEDGRWKMEDGWWVMVMDDGYGRPYSKRELPGAGMRIRARGGEKTAAVPNPG